MTKVRWSLYKSPIDRVRKSMEIKTVKDGDCWRFTGSHASGYGTIKFNGKVEKVH